MRNYFPDDARRWWIATIAIAISLTASSGPARASEFGTWCQEAWQNNWQTTLDWGYEICGSFNGRMVAGGQAQQFYYTLVNAQPHFIDPNDGVNETADLVWVLGHGGFTATNASFATWNQGVLVNSNDIRLGNTAGNTGTSIFSMYLCKMLHTADNRVNQRWSTTFRAGLRYLTGSHDLLWSGYTTDEVGYDYAAYLVRGDRIKYAWRDSISDWWEDQDISVMASGNSVTDCQTRRDTMRYNGGTDPETYYFFPRRADANFTTICWSHWTNY